MGVTMQFSEFHRAKRESDYGLENALAKYARNRWPERTIQHVAHHFDLSESEASKVVYAGASKNTLRKLLHHKRGGFALFLDLLCEATGTRLEDHIERQAQEARNAAAKWDAEERRLAIISARLGERRAFSRGGAE
jgi:hypothetical protein